MTRFESLQQSAQISTDVFLLAASTLHLFNARKLLTNSLPNGAQVVEVLRIVGKLLGLDFGRGWASNATYQVLDR
jgi:hypothetical protein